MKFKVFCVYDSKMEEFGVPMFLRSRGECLRAFSDVVKSPESPMHKHPADYTLFEVGDWDAEKGTFTQYDAKVSMGLALDFVSGRPNAEVKSEIQKPHINKKSKLRSVERSM